MEFITGCTKQLTKSTTKWWRSGANAPEKLNCFRTAQEQPGNALFHWYIILKNNYSRAGFMIALKNWTQRCQQADARDESHNGLDALTTKWQPTLDSWFDRCIRLWIWIASILEIRMETIRWHFGRNDQITLWTEMTSPAKTDKKGTPSIKS